MVLLFNLTTGFALGSTLPAAPGENSKTASVQAAPAAYTYYKVDSNSLNLREKPSDTSKIKAKFKKYTILTRLNTKNYKGGGDTWYKVQGWDNKTGKNLTGYVCSTYVKKTTNPNFSRLLNIKTSAGALCPAFTPDKLDYKLYLDDSKNEFNLSFEKNMYTTAIELNVGDTPVTENNIQFVKDAVLTVTVTATPPLPQKQKKSIYRITMLRESPDASLINALTLDGVKITPDFKSDVIEYTASVPYKTIETKATIAKMNGYAKIYYTIGGESSSDGFLPLMVGDNQLKIECVSPLGKKSTYIVNIKRAAPAKGEKPMMSALERKIVETAFQLLPERHPFVLAYEKATKRNIKSYTATRNGKKVSGVAFEYGGSGNVKGFSSRWWKRTSVSKYPVGGMDCAEFIHWVYKNVGYDVPHASSTLFLSGKEGTNRKIKGVSTHKVITSLSKAKIGDVAYNSEKFGFGSGHGNHTSLFIGTAEKLGIGDTVRKYYRNFPIKAYLVIDIGWADGTYYHNMIKKIGSRGRNDLCGVGIQFFTSIKGNNGKYIYKSPYKTGKYSFSWYDSSSRQTYRVSANIERNRRPYQYKWTTSVKNVMNLSRPIKRND